MKTKKQTIMDISPQELLKQFVNDVGKLIDARMRTSEIITKAETEGYRVDSAVDGEDALTKIKGGGYDLVLLDIIMPKMDGISVMKEVKKDPQAKPNKRLIFLTNLDNDTQIKEALTLGDGYLIKSQLTPDNLLKEVKMNLAKN